MKDQIREQMKQKLKQLSKPDYEHYSLEIAKHLYASPEWREARTLALTVSRMPEVDTFQIIRQAWSEGKNVAVPKCDPQSHTMEFFQLRAFHELETVYFGLLEPKPTVTTKLRHELLDLMIVPGLVYNEFGYRIGFGGGYYDRYLAQFHGVTVALAFTEQIAKEIPIEDHDIPINMLITPKGVHRIHE